MAPKSPSDADRHVGSRIRLRRTLTGMSQERLGDLLGITFQQIQKYEKGTNRVGAGRLVAIARALGVPVSYFFEGLAAGPGGDPAAHPDTDLLLLLSNPDGIALAQAFVDIVDPSLRQSLVRLARAVADTPRDSPGPSGGRVRSRRG